MDAKETFRSLSEGLDDAQLGELAVEVAAALESRRKRIAMEDITVERLRDPKFASEVRAELDAVLKSMR